MNKFFTTIMVMLLLACDQPFQIPAIDMSYDDTVELKSGERFTLSYRPINITDAEFKTIDPSGIMKNISGKLTCTANDNNKIQTISFDVTGSVDDSFEIYFIVGGKHMNGTYQQYQSRRVAFVVK